MSLPDGFGPPAGFFRRCEIQYGSSDHLIKIFSDESTNTVIAEWYQACGVPEGVVKPHAERPTGC